MIVASAASVQEAAPSAFVQRVIREGKAFTDFDFPADSSVSLLDAANEHGGLDSRMLQYFESLVWRRLRDVYADAEGGMAVFKKGVQSSDVR